MNEEPKEKEHAASPYAYIAMCAGTASAAIPICAFLLPRPISDSGMWAIAFMTFAPALMGIGVAYFVKR